MKSLLALLLLAALHLCPAAEYPSIVAFGDSLTDMGNRSAVATTAETKFRLTWVAQLARPKMLNITEFKPSGISSYAGGTNYAVGGATTEFVAGMGGDRNRGQHLTQQISKRYLNPAFNTDGVEKEALHIIVIGTNDLSLASISPEYLLTQRAGLERVGVEVARSTEGQIQALALAGVTDVLWGNLFDGAQAPSVVRRVTLFGGDQGPTFLAALTKATIAHNTEMDAAIERLKKANSSLKIIKLDLFAFFADIVADPAKYGFTDVTSGANDSKHLFSADGLHPTTQGHKILAEYAYGVLSRSTTAGKATPALSQPALK